MDMENLNQYKEIIIKDSGWIIKEMEMEFL